LSGNFIDNQLHFHQNLLLSNMVNIIQFLKNKKVQMWSRRLHIYVSMALLLIVLFFSITGITLNRPHLYVKSTPEVDSYSLPFPEAITTLTGNRLHVNKPLLLNYLDEQGHLSGVPSDIQIFSEVENGQLIEGEVSLNYKGPGYNSTVFIDLLNKSTEIETSHYGLVAVLNDLHKGRNSGEIWAWFIDISALLMLLFIFTGFCLLIPKKKSFQLGLKWTLFGSVVTLLIFFFAVP